MCQTVYFIYLYFTVHWTQRGCLTWKFCCGDEQHSRVLYCGLNFVHRVDRLWSSMQFSHLDSGCVQTMIFWVPRHHVFLYIDSTFSGEVSASIFIVYVTSSLIWRQLSLPRKHNTNITWVWRTGQNFRLGLLRRTEYKISYGCTSTLHFVQIMPRLCRIHYVFYSVPPDKCYPAGSTEIGWGEAINLVSCRIKYLRYSKTWLRTRRLVPAHANH
jgi:hypothetical protein